MQEICSFEINNRIYTIYDVDKVPGKESYVGQSNYLDTNVFIEYRSKEQMLLTLKHELMHIWLYENGHKNQDKNEVFSYEDLCEYSALANNSVNKVVELYKKHKHFLNFT